MQVIVEDGGQPPRSDVASVTLEVLRNFHRPVFDSSQYNISILETQNMGDVIGVVVATDDDDKVSFLRISRTTWCN